MKSKSRKSINIQRRIKSRRRIRCTSGSSSTSSRSRNGYIRNSKSNNGNIRSSSCSRKSKEISKCKDKDMIILHTTNNIRSCRCTSSSFRSYCKGRSLKII